MVQPPLHSSHASTTVHDKTHFRPHVFFQNKSLRTNSCAVLGVGKVAYVRPLLTTRWHYVYVHLWRVTGVQESSIYFVQFWVHDTLASHIHKLSVFFLSQSFCIGFDALTVALFLFCISWLLWLTVWLTTVPKPLGLRVWNSRVWYIIATPLVYQNETHPTPTT